MTLRRRTYVYYLSVWNIVWRMLHLQPSWPCESLGTHPQFHTPFSPSLWKVQLIADRMVRRWCTIPHHVFIIGTHDFYFVVALSVYFPLLHPMRFISTDRVLDATKIVEVATTASTRSMRADCGHAGVGLGNLHYSPATQGMGSSDGCGSTR